VGERTWVKIFRILVGGPVWLQRTGICKALLRPAAASPMLLLIDAVDAVGTSDLPRVRYVVAERTVVGNPQ